MNNYTCDLCHETYEQTIDDNEAYEEFKNKYPEMIGNVLGILCADCNSKVEKWLNSLTKKEKKKMRDDMRKKHPELNIM
jgi:hypothetical protein